MACIDYTVPWQWDQPAWPTYQCNCCYCRSNRVYTWVGTTTYPSTGLSDADLEKIVKAVKDALK